MQKLFTLILFSLFCSVQFANAQRNPTKDWATYYFNDFVDVNAVTTDKQGNVYITGESIYGSTFYDPNLGDFATSPSMATPGSFKDTLTQDLSNPVYNPWDVPYDAFVAKFSASGSLLWCTYYGGTDYDYGYAIVCDADGNVYMSGTTMSTTGIATPGSHQSTTDASGDAFLVKFNSAGQRQWATYYGGTGSDIATALSVDKDNNIYMGGNTASTSGISTTGAFKTTVSAGSAGYVTDGFVAKFNSAGTLQWGTYYGDTVNDKFNSLVCDAAGNVYAAGTTNSIVNIASAGSQQETQGGGISAGTQQRMTDAFLVKFDGAGQRKWATYYGGGRVETLVRVAYDKYTNSIYLGGNTSSSDNIATAGAYQTQNYTTGENEYDGFLAKFNADGQRQWGTYYGGANAMIWGTGGSGLSCDPYGNVYISHTAITQLGIATPGSYQDTFPGGYSNICLAKFNTGGERLWGTYFGGNNGGWVTDHISDAFGNIYIIGVSGSDDIATPDVFQTDKQAFPIFPGATTATPPILAKFHDCVPVTLLDVSGNTGICAGDSLKLNVLDKTAQAYQWQKDGADITGATDTLLVVKTAGAYRIIAGNGVNCIDTSDATTVAINPLPVPVVTFKGNVLSTSHFGTYQWNRNGQPIGGATDSSFTITQNDVYTVTVTDGNGCAGTSLPISTAVNDVTLSKTISIYPNPATDVLYINATAPVSVAIYDVAGKLMIQQSNAKRLDIQSFAAGLYIVKISDAAGNLLQAERFVKATK